MRHYEIGVRLIDYLERRDNPPWEGSIYDYAESVGGSAIYDATNARYEVSLPDDVRPPWIGAVVPMGMKKDAPRLVNTETTGGTRYSEGKAKRHAIPYGAMEYIAKVSERGAVKYAPYDYMEGQSFSTLLNSAMRHMEVCMRDPLAVNLEDGGVLHAAQVCWNMMCLLDMVDRGIAEEMDDVTPWRGVTADMRKEAEKVAQEEDITVVEALKEVKDGDN